MSFKLFVHTKSVPLPVMMSVRKPKTLMPSMKPVMTHIMKSNIVYYNAYPHWKGSILRWHFLGTAPDRLFVEVTYQSVFIIDAIFQPQHKPLKDLNIQIVK